MTSSIDIDIDSVNQQLAGSSPQEILKWSIENLPNLYQTTAFGLTGLAATDMIAKIAKSTPSSLSSSPSSSSSTFSQGNHPVPLIFIDTLYHFPETIALTKVVEEKYGVELHVFKPYGCSTAAQFEELYGKELWISDEDVYDYTVKVEPARRAYEELNVQAVITGRRRSQGNERAAIPPIEKDETGLIKINPLYDWSFKEVKNYIDENNVPYNPLLDQGYKSIGDIHSTKPSDSSNPSDERAGRWAGTGKKECGLHKDYFQMKKKFEKKTKEAAQLLRDASRGDDPVQEENVVSDFSSLSIQNSAE